MTDLVHLMLRCLVALWIAAGFADWLCHRRSTIEATTGLRESVFHWGQLVLVGTGMVLALFFRPTHMLLAVLFGLWMAHQGLTWIELRFVVGRRHISPLEQMVHSFLEILPLAAIALIAVLVADPAATQTQGVYLLALERASEHPGFFVCAGVGAVGLVIIPYVEELLRCSRGARGR